MSALRLFTDEDVYGVVAPALRRSGINAVATREAGRGGDSDESQLEWASNQDRAFLTFNVGHFTDLHAKWIATGRRHAGIVVSSQRPIGEVIRRLRHLASTFDGESMRDRLEFLSDW